MEGFNQIQHPEMLEIGGVRVVFAKIKDWIAKLISMGGAKLSLPGKGQTISRGGAKSTLSGNAMLSRNLLANIFKSVPIKKVC